MAISEFTQTTSDGIVLRCYKVIPKHSKAAILILHGAIEHAKRYFDFAEYLAKNDIAVYTFDQRGHGQTAADDDAVAYFSDKPKGWFQAVEDVHQIAELVKSEQKDIPFILFGHSMGAFLLRSYIAQYPNFTDKAVICATADSAKVLVAFGRMVSAVGSVLIGRTFRSKLMHALVFGTLNSRVKNPRTPFDFVSMDEKVVDAYIADPRCGNLITINFAREMLRGIAFIGKKSTYNKVRKNLPLFIISGEYDPLAGKKMVDLDRVIYGYENAGILNMRTKIYPGMRHEILNEIEKQQVYEDIKDFILE